MRAGAHGIACEGVHVRARVEASRLACLKRLDSGRVWLRGADALCIQHAYVHAVAGGALVELRQHRALRLRPRDHEDTANLQRDAAFRAVRAQLPVALDAEARLRRAGLDVVARMHDPRVAPALVKRRAGLLLEDHHAAPRAGQVPRDARANGASPDDDDVDSRHPLPSALPSFPLPDEDALHGPEVVERVSHRLLGFYGSRARAVKEAGAAAKAAAAAAAATTRCARCFDESAAVRRLNREASCRMPRSQTRTDPAHARARGSTPWAVRVWSGGRRNEASLQTRTIQSRSKARLRFGARRAGRPSAGCGYGSCSSAERCGRGCTHWPYWR